MSNTVVINMDDMVTFICTTLSAQEVEVDELLVHSVLDAATEYYINYATNEEEI